MGCGFHEIITSEGLDIGPCAAQSHEVCGALSVPPPHPGLQLRYSPLKIPAYVGLRYRSARRSVAVINHVAVFFMVLMNKAILAFH